MIAVLLASLAATADQPPASARTAPVELEHSHHGEDPGQHWFEQHRATLLEAHRLFEQRDYRGAIKLLAPLAAVEEAPDAVRSMLAANYLEAGDYAAAIAVYRQMLDRAKRSRLPEDFRVHQAMGATYVRWGKFREALESLTAALDADRGVEAAPTYALLASAHNGLGHPGEREVCARIAALAMPDFYVERAAAIAAHPLHEARCSVRVNAELIRKLEASPSLKQLVDLAKPPRPRGLAAVPMANAALDFGAVLISSGWPQTAQKYRSLGMKAVFADVAPDCEKGAEPCFAGLAEMLAAAPFQQASTEVRAATLEQIIAVLAEAGQFSHAADFAGQLAGLRPAPKTMSAWLAVQRLRSQAAANVSFDPASGALRERDPLDFLEQERITYLTEQKSYVARDDRMERARGAGGSLPLTLPYGATSASEDGATMVTFLFGAEMHPNVKAFLMLALENNIAARNLELPVKLLLDSVTDHVMDEVSPRTGKTFREMLTAAMEAEDVPPIPPTTRDAFEAAEKLATLGNLPRPGDAPQ